MINKGISNDSTLTTGYVKENFDCFYSTPNLMTRYF